MSGSKSTAFANGLLKLLLANLPLDEVGDSNGIAGSDVDGSLYFALHTADPGLGGTQATNEVGYTGYARVAKAREAASWTFVGNTATLDGALAFPECAGGSATALWLSVGVVGTGGGLVLYRVELDPSIAISSGVTPTLADGDVTFTEE